MNKQQDKEMLVIAKIAKALGQLDDEARDRIVRYIVDRFGLVRASDQPIEQGMMNAKLRTHPDNGGAQ